MSRTLAEMTPIWKTRGDRRVPESFSALLLRRLRVADLQSLTRSSTMLTAQTDYVVPVSFRTNSASKRGWSVARACSLPVSKPEGQPGDLGAILG
jgi:predicted amidophosphoribosyltransferase